jgi:hypothetical protein
LVRNNIDICRRLDLGFKSRDNHILFLSRLAGIIGDNRIAGIDQDRPAPADQKKTKGPRTGQHWLMTDIRIL